MESLQHSSMTTSPPVVAPPRIVNIVTPPPIEIDTTVLWRDPQSSIVERSSIRRRAGGTGVLRSASWMFSLSMCTLVVGSLVLGARDAGTANREPVLDSVAGPDVSFSVVVSEPESLAVPIRPDVERSHAVSVTQSSVSRPSATKPDAPSIVPPVRAVDVKPAIAAATPTRLASLPRATGLLDLDLGGTCAVDRSAVDRSAVDRSAVESCAAGVCVEEPASSLGTALQWAQSPADAYRTAAEQQKLVFLIHVSGNFAIPGFT